MKHCKNVNSEKYKWQIGEWIMVCIKYNIIQSLKKHKLGNIYQPNLKNMSQNVSHRRKRTLLCHFYKF